MPLLVKDLLCLFHLLFFLCNPHFQLMTLSVVASRRDFVLLLQLIELLLLVLLPVVNSCLSEFNQLREVLLLKLGRHNLSFI